MLKHTFSKLDNKITFNRNSGQFISVLKFLTFPQPSRDNRGTNVKMYIIKQSWPRAVFGALKRRWNIFKHFIEASWLLYTCSHKRSNKERVGKEGTLNFILTAATRTTLSIRALVTSARVNYNSQSTKMYSWIAGPLSGGLYGDSSYLLIKRAWISQGNMKFKRTDK